MYIPDNYDMFRQEESNLERLKRMRLRYEREIEMEDDDFPWEIPDYNYSKNNNMYNTENVRMWEGI